MVHEWTKLLSIGPRNIDSGHFSSSFRYVRSGAYSLHKEHTNHQSPHTSGKELRDAAFATLVATAASISHLYVINAKRSAVTGHVMTKKFLVIGFACSVEYLKYQSHNNCRCRYWATTVDSVTNNDMNISPILIRSSVQLHVQGLSCCMFIHWSKAGLLSGTIWYQL